MTVYVADTHGQVERLVSVAKMATVLEECTTEEQCSVMRFYYVQKYSMQRIFINKYFSVYGGKYLSRKAAHNLVEKFSQGRSKAVDVL
jgi:predicted DNA-binding protein YlxM (UPF0122 family)